MDTNTPQQSADTGADASHEGSLNATQAESQAEQTNESSADSSADSFNVFKSLKPKQTETSQENAPTKEQSAPAEESSAPSEKPSAPAEEPKQTLTKEEVEDLIKKAQAENKPAPAPEPEPAPKELTPEEKKKALQIYDISADDVNDIHEGGDVAIAALGRLRDGFVRQALASANYLIQHRLQQQEAQYAPYIQLAQQAQRERDDAAFYSENPDLAPHRDVVNAVFNKILNEVKSGARKEFESPSEATKTLVSEVTQLLTKSGVQLSKTEQTSSNRQPQTNKQATPKMTPQSRGGQRGSQAVNKESAVEVAGMEVFSHLQPRRPS